MSHLKLTICIATYNRGNFIGETLDSILPQLTEEVELLVVDGASTDNTESVPNFYLKKSSQLRYIRLPKKGGVDQDYNKTVELALGEMCWLFTDDDLLKPGAVDSVLAAINKGHDIVIVNAEICSVDMAKRIQERRLSVYEDTTFQKHEIERFFINSIIYLTFIGAVIIRRSIWMSRDRARYFGTEFIHIGVLFQDQLPGTAFIIAEPYIRIRYSNAQWESRRFNIWMFKWPKLVWSFNLISDKAKRTITEQEPWRNIRKLLVQRSDGEYNVQMYRQFLSNAQAGSIWKITAWTISNIPRSWITGIRSIYALLK